MVFCLSLDFGDNIVYNIENKRRKEMKKFFGEFKKFISRGNVLDLAVGVIIGSAFTAIVNALSNNILKPLINALLSLILGASSLSDVYTFLIKVYLEDGTVDLTNSVYIDWGAFINAILNFIIVAFVLFLIVKCINYVIEKNQKLTKSIEQNVLTKEDKKILKSRGISILDIKKVDEYKKEKSIAIIKKQEEEKKQAEEKAKKEREENPTEIDLLKDIKELLKEKDK